MNKAPMTITTSAAADFLTTPETRYLLAPFMSRETPMAEAAKDLGLELNTLHRRVGQMLEMGLLEVAREDVRDGHRVKLYHATSTEFIVPMEATTQIDLESYLSEIFEGVAAILSRNIARAMEKEHSRWGFRIYAEEGSSGLLQRAVPLGANEATPPRKEKTFWYGDAGLQLSNEEAQGFCQELQALYDKYRQDPNGETRNSHYFFAALAPF